MNNPTNKEGYFNHIVSIHERIGDKRKTEIKIPVDLCFLVIRKKMIPAFKVFILLKMISSGKIKLTFWGKQVLADFCGYKTVRSLNNQLKRLIDLNWIGYNRSTKIYHIRGFSFIQKLMGLRARLGFWFTVQDMQCFDSMIYGAVIGYLSKNQGKKLRIDPQKGRSNQVLSKSPGFYPVSNSYLAKILNISTSTASIMKKRAEEDVCIYVKRKRIVEPATHDVFKRLKGTYPEEYLHPIVWRYMFYQRFPDLIKANLKYGLRKKIDK